MAVEGSSKRIVAYRIVSVLFFLATGVLLWGVASLVGGWFASGSDKIHRVHFLGWGILMGVLITGALAAGMWRAERRIAALQQVFAGVFAIEIGAAVSQRWGIAGFGAAILLPGSLILLALHPARKEFFRGSGAVSLPLTVCTVIAAVPLVAYALDAASLQRNGIPSDPHVKDDHWTIMAAMAIGFVLCGFLAALRTRGWLFVAWSTGIGAALMGLASVLNVDRAGSFGRGWGIAAIAGGLVFVAEAEMERRAGVQPIGATYAGGRRRHAPAA